MSAPANLGRAIEAVILSRVGREQAIKGCEVVRVLRAQGLTLSLRRVGETVQEMRRAGRPVLSSSQHGYWMAETVGEVEEVLSELRARRRQLDAAIRQIEISGYTRGQVGLMLDGVRP